MADVGRQLADVRATRQLSVDDVASRLLLSRAQVLGLEAGEASAFYTAAYFLKGLRKYMAFAGIPEDRLDLAQAAAVDDGPAEDPDALRLTLAEPVRGAALAPVAARWPRAAGVVAAAVVAVAAGVMMVRARPATGDAGSLSETVRLETAAPLPAEPLRVAASPPQPIQPAPAVLDDDDATVRLSVGKATWVFVRFPDNRVTERRLAAGEAFEVGPLPVYLAIGTADSVDLRVEDRPVPLGPYIRNGQVRITKPELAALKESSPR